MTQDENDEVVTIIVCLLQKMATREQLKHPTGEGLCGVCNEAIWISQFDLEAAEHYRNTYFVCITCAAKNAPNATMTAPDQTQRDKLRAVGVSDQSIEDACKIPLRELGWSVGDE